MVTELADNVKNLFRTEKCFAGEGFVFDGGDGFLLTGGAGKVSAFWSVSMARASVFEGEGAIHGLAAGFEVEVFEASVVDWVFFLAFGWIGVVVKGSVDTDVDST